MPHQVLQRTLQCCTVLTKFCHFSNGLPVQTFFVTGAMHEFMKKSRIIALLSFKTPFLWQDNEVLRNRNRLSPLYAVCRAFGHAIDDGSHTKQWIILFWY